MCTEDLSRLNSLIIITGLTASGKSIIAIRCAKYLSDNFNVRAEIINADSIQLYDELKILTDHPSKDTVSITNHHLYGILSPYETPSVSAWLELAKGKIDQLHKENKIAIVCGGSGFYINALVNGISNIPKIPKIFRSDIQKKFQELGREKFFNQLAILDPELCKTLHKNNTHRVLRAYEVVSYTKKSISQWWKDDMGHGYKTLPIVLIPQRDRLSEKCLFRINEMIRSGAIEEVKNFIMRYPHYNGPMRNVIGYNEIISFLDKKITLPECIQLIHTGTMRYAKRQSTWFRNQLKLAKIICKFGEEINEISDFISQS